MFSVGQVFSIGGIIGAVLQLLFPAPWAFLYRAPIGFLIGYIVGVQQTKEGGDRREGFVLGIVCGPGGALVFLIFGMLRSVLTALLALAIMWMAVQVTVERRLHTGMEKAYGVTGIICVTTWLVWMISAALVIVVGASVR